jgi:hypothetical protein
LKLSDEKKKRNEDNFEDKSTGFRKIKETTRPEWFLVTVRFKETLPYRTLIELKPNQINLFVFFDY